jgi:hypothetical protein
MLRGVSRNGIYTKNAEATWTTRGAGGVPTYWDIEYLCPIHSSNCSVETNDGVVYTTGNHLYIKQGQSITGTIELDEGYSTVTVLMDTAPRDTSYTTTDITSSAFDPSTNTLYIPNVTGVVNITAS